MEIVVSHVPRRLWRGFVDLVAPPLCLGCGVPAGAPASLCPSCWPRLQQIDEPACEALGTPFAHAQGEGARSPAAIADPPPWDSARAAVLFDDVSARLVHALKYQDRQEAGLLMARLMARAGRNLLAGADLMLPVPLHRFRLWQRRFNQSAFLAKELSRLSGTPWRQDLLVRRRRTRAQVGLDAAARRRNVKDAFVLRPGQAGALAGRSILLVDDVRTTGATAEACATLLKEAGAARVCLLTFALVALPAKPHI